MIASAASTFCNPVTNQQCLVKILSGLSPAGIADAIGKSFGGVISSAAGHLASSATNSAVNQLAQAIETGIGQVLTDTLTFWVKLRSPNLASDPVPRLMQEYLWPWTVGVAMIGFIVIGARMALTRRGAPLADLGQGLLIIACTTAAGTILPTLLLEAGDEWSSWVLQASTGGRFAYRFGHMFGMLSSGTNSGVAAGVVIVVGVVFMIAAVVQGVLLLFRMGSVVILAGVLPLAAAGSLNPLMKPGFKKITGWMLALIMYKPIAAMVMATGFLMFGKGRSVVDLFTGLAVIILSLVAMPSLMKFFTWSTGELAGSGGSLLGTVIGAATAVGAMRGGGGSAASGQASNLNNGLGSARNGTGGGNPPSGGQANGTGPQPGRPPGGGSQGQGQGQASPQGGAGNAARTMQSAGGKAAAGPAGAVAAGGTIVLGAAQGLADSSGPPKGGAS